MRNIYFILVIFSSLELYPQESYKNIKFISSVGILNSTVFEGISFTYSIPRRIDTLQYKFLEVSNIKLGTFHYTTKRSDIFQIGFSGGRSILSRKFFHKKLRYFMDHQIGILYRNENATGICSFCPNYQSNLFAFTYQLNNAIRFRFHPRWAISTEFGLLLITGYERKKIHSNVPSFYEQKENVRGNFLIPLRLGLSYKI